MSFKEWRALTEKGRPSSAQVAKAIGTAPDTVKKYASGVRGANFADWDKLLELDQPQAAKAYAEAMARGEPPPQRSESKEALEPAAKPIKEPSAVEGSPGPMGVPCEEGADGGPAEKPADPPGHKHFLEEAIESPFGRIVMGGAGDCEEDDDGCILLPNPNAARFSAPKGGAATRIHSALTHLHRCSSAEEESFGRELAQRFKNIDRWARERIQSGIPVPEAVEGAYREAVRTLLAVDLSLSIPHKDFICVCKTALGWCETENLSPKKPKTFLSSLFNRGGEPWLELLETIKRVFRATIGEIRQRHDRMTQERQNLKPDEVNEWNLKTLDSNIGFLQGPWLDWSEHGT